MSTVTSRIARLLGSALAIAFIIASASDSALCQTFTPFDIGTPSESKTGLSGLSTYAQDKVETVNLANGNMVVHIPLVTVGGRGSAAYTVALNYNSKLWAGAFENDSFSDPFGGPNPVLRNGVSYDDTTGGRPNMLYLGSGWAIQQAPAIKIRVVNIDPLFATPKVSGYQFIITKMWLELPDGSEVELRDALTQGAPAPTPTVQEPNSTTHPMIDINRGQVWVSTDGSAITFIANQGSNQTPAPVVNGGPTDGTVFMPDGTRLIIRSTTTSTGAILSGRCTAIIDRNGNKLDITYDDTIGMTTYTDSLGRQVVLSPLMNNQTPPVQIGATVTIQGYNGTPTRTITVNAEPIQTSQSQSLLRSDYANAVYPIIAGDYDASTQFQPTTPATRLFVDQNGISADIGLDGHSVSEELAVSSLVLLDGRTFQFRYNTFGELAEITYPGGGVSQINYQALGSNLCEGGNFISQLNRAVVERRTISNPANACNPTQVDADWNYTYQPYASPSTSTVMVTQGVGGPLLMSEAHTFIGIEQEHRTCYRQTIHGMPQGTVTNGTGYDEFGNGLEYQDVRQTGSGTQTEAKTWMQRIPDGQTIPVVWPTDSASYVAAHGAGEENIPEDPRVMEEDTTLDSGQEKSVVYAYDQFNNEIQIVESDYGPTSPGPTLRTTNKVYAGDSGAAINPNPNPYCYTGLDGLGNSDGVGCGGGVAPGFGGLSANPDDIIHLRRLLLMETITGPKGLESSTTYEYDNYMPGGPGHAALVQNPTTMSNGTQTYKDPWTDFTVSYEPRGNLTMVTRTVGDGATTVEYGQYDDAGNVVAKIDPNGNKTTYGYTDNFGDGSNLGVSVPAPSGPTFALLTSVTNALNQTSLAQYDYTRGEVTGDEDPNGVITRTTYDVYDRPLSVTAALGKPEQVESVFTYPALSTCTVNNNFSTISKQLDSSRWVSTETIYDGYGRPVTAGENEDGNPASSANFTITSQTTYDGLGRVSMKTNPQRAGFAPTNGSTVTQYDLLGRPMTVTTYDNSSTTTDSSSNTTGTVTTMYVGNQTTVTDQAGKQRRSSTDGLGRLSEVDELQPAPSTAIYNTTTYSYDGRGNLLTVTQGTSSQEIRMFSYDGLSRLTSATNPESGTVGYTYDLDGNLKTKTDNRQVVTTYTYDALNRLKTRTYTNPASNPNVADSTPTVTYSYDGENGKGYNGETVNYSTGRLTYVTSSVSTETIDNYDSLGRVLQSTQITGGQSYGMIYTYNLAGDILTEQYPSGRVVTSAYDGAGRLNSLTGALSSTVASKNYATSFTYTAPGGISSLNLGNGLWENTTYNSRLQPIQMGLGTSSTDSSTFGLSYTFGVLNGQTVDTTKNNGNIQSETITPGAGTPITQTFTYDQVNRLATAAETNGGSTTWSRSFSYDVFSNMWVSAPGGSPGIPLNPLTPTAQTAYSTANNNQLAESTYDLSGNQSEDGQGGMYYYDGENRMTRCTVADVQSSYSYDGNGRRITKNVGGTTINGVTTGGITTTFVYNSGGSLIAEYGGSGTPNTGTSYLTTDHLGSTRVVTNNEQEVVSRHDYLPFGEEITVLAGGRTRGLNYGALDDTRQKFTSKERDDESGLDYFGARYYSSANARFTGPDHLVYDEDHLLDPQRLNLYSYTRDNPLNAVDPNGEDIKYEGGTAGQQQANRDAVAALRSQSDTANKLFQPFDKPDINLTVKVVPDKDFEDSLTTVGDADKPKVSGDTQVGPGGVQSDVDKSGQFVVTKINVEIDLRSSAVNKKKEDKEKKDKDETNVEAIMSHEVKHANDEVTIHSQVNGEKSDNSKNDVPYHDRPNEKRANATSKQIAQERKNGGHIRKTHNEKRW
jgi:RHS repeat-associated protein